MEYEFRNCTYDDVDFIVDLKDFGLKWYMETIYGWDRNVQKEKTIRELDRHINDMKIITSDKRDIGITTFYSEDDKYVIGLTIIHPDYQNKGIATSILSGYINIAKSEKKRIIIKTYIKNPARRLYERLGFKLYDTNETHAHYEIDFSKVKENEYDYK
ncbi:MAG: GNAT family N-acetyltransferase [Eubacterium sp.]|nr:GNAT family N-acetyltransferase [Eubacterium sp.]